MLTLGPGFASACALSFDCRRVRDERRPAGAHGGRLHPLQIAARGPNAVLSRVVRDVPTILAPRTIDDWSSPQPALRQLANAERVRGTERLTRLPAGRLHAYESCYGLELGADESVQPADWQSHVAIEPFPASVRARRLAVAIGVGGAGWTESLRVRRAECCCDRSSICSAIICSNTASGSPVRGQRLAAVRQTFGGPLGYGC